MFEKEAEEYAERTKTGKEIEVLNTVHDWGQESLSPSERRLFEGIQDRQKAREQAFQDGAEFGYNKANEWHYVKDGDLPKVGVQVLSEQGTLVIYKGDGFNWVEYSPNADNIKLRKWEEPIAWKEIVLPELKIKENDET